MTLDLFGPRGLPPLIPERVKEAREASGYTREAFAEALTVSVQAVAQYESGQSAPGPDIMGKIITLTKQPPSFFTAERVRSGERFGTPFWRSLVRMKRPDRLRISRRLEWTADVVSYVERFIELPSVRLPTVTAPRGPDDMAALESAAEAVRDLWELGDLPIRHLAPTLEVNGIILVKESVKCEDMDAVSRWQCGRPYILQSKDKQSLPRENFDLAHELGHILAHSHIEVTSANLPTIERQANYFAGALLLPRRTFPQEVISTSLDYFLELKPRWRVSAQAMVSRCKDLGILNKHQVQYLWRQIGARQMRTHEEGDDAFELERPTLLSAALNMLVEKRVQTRAQIVESLKLNPQDIELLTGAELGFLDTKVVQLGLKPRSD